MQVLQLESYSELKGGLGIMNKASQISQAERTLNGDASPHLREESRILAVI